jgi:hypothetical protein
LAYSLNRPEQAIAQYKLAVERARARDDADAIGDYGYNLVVAQLAANQPQRALASAQMTQAELARRGAASFPALDLAKATALYRLGDKQASDRLAEQVQDGSDESAAARASFLRGLIADETDYVSGLDDALARLARPGSPAQQADADELAARCDLRRHSFVTAAAKAEQAADLRRSILDYRGMVRALAVAADAEARAGNTRASADLYLRAGQSAAAQGDAASARPWLEQAMHLGSDPALFDAARLALASLSKSSPPH